MKLRLLEMWKVLRTLSTDDAYERYLDHHGREHANTKPMARREFYMRQQRSKWSGVSRCC